MAAEALLLLFHEPLLAMKVNLNLAHARLGLFGRLIYTLLLFGHTYF